MHNLVSGSMNCAMKVWQDVVNVISGRLHYSGFPDNDRRTVRIYFGSGYRYRPEADHVRALCRTK